MVSIENYPKRLKTKISRVSEDIIVQLKDLSISKKKVIWVASYPRSGSGWLRKIITALYDSSDSPILVVNPYQNPKKAFILAKEVDLGKEKICFLKTHYNNFPTHIFPEYLSPKIVNYGFIYLYRHPLDVFLSSLNYLYINNRKDCFFEGEIQSVEELKNNGKLDTYIQRFIETLSIGNDAFKKMCGGSWLEHVNSWIKLHQQEQSKYLSIVLRYEDMHKNTLSALKPLAELLGKDEKSLEKAIASTQSNPNGKLRWRQKTSNYKDYLKEEDINQFQNKYKDVLDRLGLSGG